MPGMNGNAPTSLTKPLLRRSVFVTLLAWIIIVISALLVPISFISFLMILAGSDGTSSVDALGFLTIVVAPPATVIGGIGLLMRRAWARYYVIALLWLLIAINLWQLLNPRPETTTHTSSTGVKTTVVTSYGYSQHRLPIVVICSVLLAGLCWPSVREEFKRPSLSGMSAPQHADNAEPVPVGAHREWKSGHHEHGGTLLIPKATPKQRAALFLVIAILFGITIGMAWLAISGINSGTTYLPTKRASQQRTVVRQHEPATFWLCTGVYTVVGLGAAGASLWCIRQACRRDL